MGDMYSSQSLNRYSYVMNNPVNMWDPTGHVPEWVGDDTHLEISGDKAVKHILLSNSSSNSGWYNIGTVDNGKEIIYKYQATITKTWVYKRYLGLYDERIDDFKFILGHNVTYSQTDYYFDDVVVPASKIAEESEKAIQELVGNPPKNTDPPVISIRTKQVGKNPVQLMNDPEEIIVMNTGNNQTEAQSLITGAVQSELKAIMDIDLKASGVYGNSTEGAVTDFQEASNLLANGALTYETFYKIQNIYGQYKEITDKLNNLYNTDGASSSLTANLEKKLRELVAPYRNKGTGKVDETYVTKEQLEQLYKDSKHFLSGKVTDDMVNELNRVLNDYNITTTEQIQYFLAVSLHESRLALTEAGWLSETSVKQYCAQYEPNTQLGKDLGNTKQGDGYLFRGAGYIQLTGRYNYQIFANDMGDQEIVKQGADYVAEKYAWEAAGYFWEKNNINSIIETGINNKQDVILTFKQVSNTVNRGPNATYSNSPPGEWVDRQNMYNTVIGIIN